jgi:hypothetical protein
MRVLVTGARGKVGTATTKALIAAGHEVTCTDVLRGVFERPAPGEPPYLQADLTNPGDAFANGTYQMFAIVLGKGLGQSRCALVRNAHQVRGPKCFADCLQGRGRHAVPLMTAEALGLMQLSPPIIEWRIETLGSSYLRIGRNCFTGLCIQRKMKAAFFRQAATRAESSGLRSWQRDILNFLRTKVSVTRHTTLFFNQGGNSRAMVGSRCQAVSQRLNFLPWLLDLRFKFGRLGPKEQIRR